MRGFDVLAFRELFESSLTLLVPSATLFYDIPSKLIDNEVCANNGMSLFTVQEFVCFIELLKGAEDC